MVSNITSSQITWRLNLPTCHPKITCGSSLNKSLLDLFKKHTEAGKKHTHTQSSISSKTTNERMKPGKTFLFPARIQARCYATQLQNELHLSQCFVLFASLLIFSLAEISLFTCEKTGSRPLRVNRSRKESSRISSSFKDIRSCNTS